MLRHQLISALADLPIGEIHYFERIRSTNTFGKELLGGKTNDFDLIYARDQTAGRGRFERVWISKPRSSLTFSVIIHPTEAEKKKLPFFSALAALTLCDTISNYCISEAKIKWPNDVLLENRKSAGILTEAHWDADQLSGIVLGIGINLLSGAVPPDDQVMYPATCVQDHCESAIHPGDFLRALIKRLIEYRPLLQSTKFLTRYTNHLAFLGEEVSIGNPKADTFTGRFLGVNQKGEARLETATGDVLEMAVGDLRLRPMSP